ncbi:ribonuclease M5 [Spiroplasma endosymbiont of Dioctria linearis]|uniref:ribonuclease M5 n=1 Tax=Spiroplasma endosymbiont of Dioctria linearis TaxID=3066290 RepID=UPI00313E8F2B
MKIKQVIIVEGVTDTAKLKKIFGNDNVDTIETNGLALSKNTLNFISDVNSTRGVIILTDPDGPGLKIRETINIFLNFKCFNAFINKKRINNSKKIGLAEAEDNDIKESLSNLITFDSLNLSITWEDFLKNEFYKPQARKKIAQKYNWSEKINSKTLFKWVNYINLNVKELKKIVGE